MGSDDFSVKLRALLRSDKQENTIVLFLLATTVIFFIAGIASKWNDGEDTTVDLLKIAMVWTNIFLLAFLLYQKKIIVYGTFAVKVIYSLAIVINNILLFCSLILIIVNAENPTEDDGGSQTLNRSRDFIMFSVTFFTDLLYLLLFFIFKSSRAMCTSVVLIIIEIAILAVSAANGSDFAIDTANLAISLVTCFLAVVLWSAKVALDNTGNPTEFKDFFEREDLQDMEVIMTSEA